MVSNRDRESQQKAIAAAKDYISKNTGKTINEMAADIGVSRSSISSARLILTYGTPEEIKLMESSVAGLKTLSEAIQKRLSPEQVLSFKVDAQRVSEKRRANDKAARELWSNMSLMFKGITDMPAPKDVVKYVASNYMRETTINAQIDNVANWIREFAYEWQFYQLSKSSNRNTDSTGGDAPAGTQHPQQAD